MRLLHGSYTEILTPDLSICKGKNDFGKGFYLTPNWKRAWQMGKRSTFLYGGEITVNAFLFYPNLSEKKGLRIKIFEGFTTEWAKFILQNRVESRFKHNFDIVIGPVADAFIDQEIKNYIQQYGETYLEESNLNTFVSKISQFVLSYIQYCFCTQKAINELIKD